MDTEDIEDGELPSSPEHENEETTTYNPLPRPENLNPSRSSALRSSREAENAAMLDEDSMPGDGIFQESDNDSDSDFEGQAAKRKYQRAASGMDVDKNDGGGDVFKKMAAKFQAERKAESKRNNVWGSILQEDALTSGLEKFTRLSEQFGN